jgi:hypothetical protein
MLDIAGCERKRWASKAARDGMREWHGAPRHPCCWKAGVRCRGHLRGICRNRLAGAGSQPLLVVGGFALRLCFGALLGACRTVSLVPASARTAW